MGHATQTLQRGVKWIEPSQTSFPEDWEKKKKKSRNRCTSIWFPSGAPATLTDGAWWVEQKPAGDQPVLLLFLLAQSSKQPSCGWDVVLLHRPPPHLCRSTGLSPGIYSTFLTLLGDTDLGTARMGEESAASYRCCRTVWVKGAKSIF